MRAELSGAEPRREGAADWGRSRGKREELRETRAGLRSGTKRVKQRGGAQDQGSSKGAGPGSFWRQGWRSRKSCGSCLAAAGRTQSSRQGLLSLPPAMERLTLPPGGAEAVDEYLEYRR